MAYARLARIVLWKDLTTERCSSSFNASLILARHSEEYCVPPAAPQK